MSGKGSEKRWNFSLFPKRNSLPWRSIGSTILSFVKRSHPRLYRYGWWRNCFFTKLNFSHYSFIHFVVSSRSCCSRRTFFLPFFIFIGIGFAHSRLRNWYFPLIPCRQHGNNHYFIRLNILIIDPENEKIPRSPRFRARCCRAHLWKFFLSTVIHRRERTMNTSCWRLSLPSMR